MTLTSLEYRELHESEQIIEYSTAEGTQHKPASRHAISEASTSMQLDNKLKRH